VARSKFWRLPAFVFGDATEELPAVIPFDSTKIALVKRGHGILVGSYEEAKQCASTTHIGIVLVVDKNASQIEVQWKKKELILRPHASGAVHWKKDDVFNFEPNVAKRYLFKSIFAEEYNSVGWSDDSIKHGIAIANELNKAIAQDEWVEVKRTRFPKSGFVYLIKKANFYKFQGSKELPHKSPFFLAAKSEKLEIVNVAWFTDFKYAESDLQSKFHEHRFDGEYLHLSEGDIQTIRALGVLVNKSTLRIDGTTVKK
jgi:hypothetical protein